MKPRVCIGCGEPIAEVGNALSRNPNLCASCSSMADGMEQPDAREPALPAQERFSAQRAAAQASQVA